MISLEMKDELKSFSKIPGELVMAVMLMADVDLETLASWGCSITDDPEKKMVCDFANVIVGHGNGGEAETLDLARNLLSRECPELAEYFEGVFNGSHDDDIAF